MIFGELGVKLLTFRGDIKKKKSEILKDSLLAERM